MIFSSDGGSGVGCCIACGFKEKNDERLFLDKWSAVVLSMPAICVDVISISYMLQKTQASQKVHIF